jgi:hypothetical protein
MTKCRARCPTRHCWIGPSPDSKHRAFVIWATRILTCTMASSPHWTTPSGFISDHRAAHAQERFVTVTPPCRVLPCLRQTSRPLWRSSNLSMRIINRQEPSQNRGPAGDRHIGIEVGAVPSHFLGGGPLILQRSPASLYRLNAFQKRARCCRAYFLICSERYCSRPTCCTAALVSQTSRHVPPSPQSCARTYGGW